MKIAIFEPWPRTAGITKWAYELAPGFRALGHHCDVVSFTKSGRPYAIEARDGGGVRKGWRWWTQAPDVVDTWDNSVSVLDSYDLVILNEPKNNPLDEQAKKAGPSAWPDYVHTMYYTKTPWTTAFHDAVAYKPHNAPYINEIFLSPSFSGMAVQCRRGAFDAAAQTIGSSASKVNKLLNWPWLPYTLVADGDHVRRDNTIGIGGRVLSTKGFASLYSVGHEIPSDFSVLSFGAESGGMGPCPSFVMFETLVMKHRWVGTRGDITFDSPNRSQASIQMGNFAATNVVAPWAVKHANTGHLMRYTGAYMSALEEWSKVAICAQLSTDALVSTFEYTTLEAMDAGCAMVLPHYYQRDMQGVMYDVQWLKEYRLGTSMRKASGITWHSAAERSELIDALHRAADRVRNDGYDPNFNWDAIRKYHDPQHLARHILENI